jgi:hypothetical protein
VLYLLVVLAEQFIEIRDRAFQPILEADAWLPFQGLASARDVRASLARIVLG